MYHCSQDTPEHSVNTPIGGVPLLPMAELAVPFVQLEKQTTTLYILELGFELE
jgi:hypothetical protein